MFVKISFIFSLLSLPLEALAVYSIAARPI